MQTNIEASADKFVQAPLHTIYYWPFCLHLALLAKRPLIFKRFSSVGSIKKSLHNGTIPALVCPLLTHHLHAGTYYHTIAPRPLRITLTGGRNFCQSNRNSALPQTIKRALTSPKTTCHNPLNYRYVPLFSPCASNRLCRQQCRQKTIQPTLHNCMIFNLLHPKSARCRQEPKKQYGNVMVIC